MPQNKRRFRKLSAFLSVGATTLSLLCLAADAPDPDANNPKRGGNAATRAETDDATARREAQRDWYETPFTADYAKWLNGAAARERARNKHLLPSVDASGNTVNGTIDSGAPYAGTSSWTNLGPMKADVLKNGSTTLNKTDSGRPVAIVPHPTDANTLYVAMAGGGVWKTTNALTAPPTWTAITESLGSLSCGALAIDPANPATLYLGLGDSFDGTGIGFTKTTDGGATWAPVIYLGASTKITEIRVAEDNSNVVLVATDAGLFRSADAGTTFALVNIASGTAAPYCWSIASGGPGKFALSLEGNHAATSGTTDGQVWYSGDDGATWAKATGMTKTTGVGRITVASSPKNRSIMFAEAAVPNSSASTDLADFFRSSDGGHTWTAMNATSRKVSYTNRNTESSSPSTLLNGQGWYNQLVVPSNTDSNTVFFGGALLLARANNATTSSPSYTEMTNWLAQFGLPYVHADFHAAAYDANGRLFVGTDGGLFMSGDQGTTWTDAYNIGIVSHLVYSVGSSDANTNAVIGGLQDNGTRVRSTTTPTTFDQELGGDGFGSHIHALNGNTMLGSLYYTRIYKSTDGGNTFVSASSGIAESNNSSAAPFNTRIVPWLGDSTGNTVFTHVNLKVYKSTNYAGSWTALGTTGLPTSGNIRNIGVASSDANYVGTVWNGGRVYLTSNSGASWTATTPPTNNGLSMSYVWFDSSNPQTVYVASVAPDPKVPHLWKSTNFGSSWTVLDVDGSGFPSGVPVNAIKNDYNQTTATNTLYAGTHLGVYQSTDGGTTWTRYGANMPLVNVTDLYVSPSHSRVRAATFGRGFWELLP